MDPYCSAHENALNARRPDIETVEFQWTCRRLHHPLIRIATLAKVGVCLGAVLGMAAGPSLAGQASGGAQRNAHGTICLGPDLSAILEDSRQIHLTLDGTKRKIVFDGSEPRIAARHLDLSKPHAIQVFYNSQPVASMTLDFSKTTATMFDIWRAEGGWRSEPNHANQCRKLILAEFAALMDRSVIEAAFARPGDFSFSGHVEDQAAVWKGSAGLPGAQSGDLYAFSVQIATATTFLRLEEWAERRARIASAHSDRGPEFLANEFPSIGSRAQREFFGFGPGGAYRGVTFTTSDGRWDVRVLFDHRLHESVPDPGFDELKAAMLMSDRYDARLRP